MFLDAQTAATLRGLSVSRKEPKIQVFRVALRSKPKLQPKKKQSGQSFSLRLNDEDWDALVKISQKYNLTLSDAVKEIINATSSL